MFELANPWALLLILLAPVLWYSLPRAKTRLPDALKVPFYADLQKLKDETDNSIRQQPLYLPFLIWTLAVIAISGPRWVGEPQPVSRKGYNIMLALDLSGSMEIPDMMYYGRPARRLTVVKQAAETFVKERHGDKIGLILFGTRAYLQSPLTYDHKTVLERIKDATVGLAGKTTSIGDALGLAVKRLQDAPAKGRIIILLTDGANNSGILLPEKAAELAKDEKIKIYTIGLGSEADPRALGNPFLISNASSDLDEKTLKEVAKLTEGKYYRATDAESLKDIYLQINALESVQQKQQQIRPQKDYYPWPLSLAVLCLLIWLFGFTEPSWKKMFAVIGFSLRSRNDAQ